MHFFEPLGKEVCERVELEDMQMECIDIKYKKRRGRTLKHILGQKEKSKPM
jgi:hypothetical protein